MKASDSSKSKIINRHSSIVNQAGGGVKADGLTIDDC
jgi:hypothetical protein